MKKILLAILIITLVFSVNIGFTADDWQSPTGHTEGNWIQEENAYNEDTSDAAFISVLGESWSEGLELTINALSCDKVRFFAYLSFFNSIDLDVYYDGSYHHVYEGAYVHRDWVEKSLGGTYSVTKVLMKFYNSDASARGMNLYEFDFNQVSLPAGIVWNGITITKWNGVAITIPINTQ